jgi:RHS repeat-associated protein
VESPDIASIKWTLQGKIKEINRTPGSLKKDIKFEYDVQGNRIAKHLYNGSTWLSSTYYSRDAQGNVMSTYLNDYNVTCPSCLSYRAIEYPIYGSSRLGIDKHERELLGTSPSFLMYNYERFLGKKQFELSNHLGNITTVFTDKKYRYPDGTNTNVDYFLVDVISTSDYYPFGDQMKGRDFITSNYRYGFNGKENDNEVKGAGNQQDYGLRIYDPRLGRFLSLDPLSKNFPWFSPYHFAGNTPIQAIDLEGAETLNKVFVKVDEQGTTFMTNPDASRLMEITNGHDWSGTKEVKVYFVKKKGSEDYKYFDSKNPGEAEAKMRAEGVKFGNPEITKQMMKSPSRPNSEMEKMKRAMKNYVTGFLLPVAIEGFVANPSVLEGVSIFLDTDEMVGGAANEDSALESVLPDGNAKAAFNVVKGVVDFTGKTTDLIDLGQAKSTTEKVKKTVTAAKGEADVIDDGTSAADNASEPQ